MRDTFDYAIIQIDLLSTYQGRRKQGYYHTIGIQFVIVCELNYALYLFCSSLIYTFSCMLQKIPLPCFWHSA